MTKTQRALETFPGEPATRFYISEADELTETHFCFAEPDGCARCGKPFSEHDVVEGIEWFRDDPMHKACFDEYGADLYEGWRGSMTL